MENTVSQKLDAMVKLQSIDSKLDEIKKIRGDLPEEVQDLEDEIAGYETRIDKFKSELSDLEASIDQHKANIKSYKDRVAHLQDQQMNVRNNREYDAINKELEMLDLDEQVSNKKIKQDQAAISAKKEQIIDTKTVLEERKKDLSSKKVELDEIISETEIEEEKLMKQREKALKNIQDERLIIAYDRIRSNAVNGLAVVSVKKSACGGCFNVVPPQRQADIKERKKIIVCEHCGRVLAGVEEEVIEEKPKKRTTRRKKKED